ncbi:DUF6087 family protein [Streptomyces sp. NPDC005533]|uniref:DUF6087 family protein n=1 Tax=Streptomyces sp. NPDC005533 TaxID=3364723 RepID=UPI0036A9DD49
MDDEEPLEEWARRRDERRSETKGKLRAVPIGGGPHRGTHVDPGSPRVVEVWTGEAWEPVCLVENLIAAKALLYPPQPVGDKPAEWDRPPLGKGRGRHRKPTAAEEREQ